MDLDVPARVRIGDRCEQATRAKKGGPDGGRNKALPIHLSTEHERDLNSPDPGAFDATKAAERARIILLAREGRWG